MIVRRSHAVLAACLLLGSSPLFGALAPAAQVKSRVSGLRELGAAFKNANDALRASEPEKVMLRYSARQIRAASTEQYRWFPAGSGPQPGLKTGAKAEIWTNPAGFKSVQDAFAAQAVIFERAVTAGDVDAMRAEARKLGGTCKGCHQDFRLEEKK